MREFVRRVQLDRADVHGARWWNESFASFVRGNQRRTFMGNLARLVIGGGVVGLGFYQCVSKMSEGDDDAEVTLDAIELQRREGWNVGYSDRHLASSAHVPLDVNQGADWRDRLQSLAGALAPEDRLRPYAVPTLFQSLADPSAASLRQEILPTHTAEMDAVAARGQALLSLAGQSSAPGGLAVISDLPGPLSVALAAALASRFSPVFTFDNWPHPLGVVPSQDTLGACLYYLPRFEQIARTRPTPAPPLFVLDANRLAPYRDAASQFDNRYVAPLPSAATFASLGVKHILYVRPDDRSLTELDDLNDDFVELQRQGIEVRAVALSDFAPTGPPSAPIYLYGGGMQYHHVFWRSYGWGPAFSRSAPPPRPLASALYRPVARPTIFASRVLGGASGIGRQKPSGFGRVSVRMDPAGRLSSYGSVHRSGSFGRSRSSSSG